MTLTFNPWRARVTFVIHNTKLKRSVGSKERVETDRQTDGRTDGRYRLLYLPGDSSNKSTTIAQRTEREFISQINGGLPDKAFAHRAGHPTAAQVGTAVQIKAMECEHYSNALVHQYV